MNQIQIRASKGSNVTIRALYSSANCGPNSREGKNAYILVETLREACERRVCEIRKRERERERERER